MQNDVFILSAQRTAIGSFQGQFAGVTAVTLGSTAIKAAIDRAGIATDLIGECTMGQVLAAGAGQAPARQAALGAGLPRAIPCMTINKVCGSGLKAVMLAADSIALGRAAAAVAGGQESMTLAPHLLTQSRAGYRMGPIQAQDSMLTDGLWDPYNNWHMGQAAELCVREYKLTREAQDAFAKQSYQRAQAALQQGAFTSEIADVEIVDKKGSVKIRNDEEPGRAQFDKMATLRAAFEKDGTITAANASKINDGAAALVLASSTLARKHQPMARIVAQAHFAQDPKWFTTAPVEAMRRAVQGAGLKTTDIDLWEINEAFAAVTMAAMRDLDLDPSKVNVHGGAIALGHPIGASGARILTTLLHALVRHQKRYGVASLCLGGGEAVAVVVERV